MTTYRSEFRFDEENVVWMSDNFLYDLNGLLGKGSIV